MISDHAIHAFITLPEFIQRNIGWYVFGFIVVIGLFVIGLSDVLRFSLKRVWAISNVNFAESIRRRVLWITPLAILAIIIITQLQKPVDAQDAIRQTTKVALFTTGTLVMLVTIILACTNLPKEIDNRVIFTVVTKPATRLEIILGKVLGFARVSAAILLIMGVFTWGYLHLREWSLTRQLQAQLDEGVVVQINRPTYEHYVSAGLLHAKRLQWPSHMDIHSRLPDPQENRRWVFGGFEQEIYVPIHARPDQLNAPGQPTPANGLVLLVEMDFEQRPLTDEELQRMGMELAEEPEAFEMGPGIAPAPRDEQADEARRLPTPQVLVSILDRNGYLLIRPDEINDARPMDLPRDNQPARVYIPPAAAQTIASELRVGGLFHVQFVPVTQGVEYALPLQVRRTGIPANVTVVVPPAVEMVTPTQVYQFRDLPAQVQLQYAHEIVATTAQPEFRGRMGRFGQQLRGGDEQGRRPPMAVFAFREATVRAGADGMVPMEMPRVGVERDASELLDVDQPTDVSIQVRNFSTGEISEPIIVQPENNRPTYFSVPAAAVAGGNFDVILQCITPGDFVGLRPTESLVMVAGQQSFAFNLFKSLLILWLLSVLVIIVSIFCSTFLSWPIAVVLTTVILLGHYGVQRLGEEGPGLGTRVASELGFQDAARARVVSESVEAINRAMHLFGAILPDIARFSATEDVERGISIPAVRLVDSFRVAFGFGIPMMVLGYVFLRNKEVAP
jgi:hypothetical protein